MPTVIATFATGGVTYQKGAIVAADDPAVLRLPDLFSGVKPAATPPKLPRKAAPKKEND
jgi:hypothetical protein